MLPDPLSHSSPASPYDSENDARKPLTYAASPTPSDDDDIAVPKLNWRLENGIITFNPSPSPSPRPRSSLSRSESAPDVVLADVPFPTTTQKPMPRISSSLAQISTPAATTVRQPMSSGLTSTQRKVTGARRVRLDELRETAESKENNDMHPTPSMSTSTRPLQEVIPVPQRTSTSQGRQMLPMPHRSMRLKRPEVITEIDEPIEEPEPYERPRSALEMSPGKTRPRRSASMSEARGDEPHHAYNPTPVASTYLRSTAVRGARRVTLEEKIRQEQELLCQSDGMERPYSQDSDELERRALELVNAHAPPGEPRYEPHHTPSPPRVHAVPAHHNLKSLYGHQRKDSETLRNDSPVLGSPTMMNHMTHGASPGHRDSDPMTRGGYGGPSAGGMQRHRRSPTAPDAPTPGGLTASQAMARTWSAAEGEDGEGSSGEVNGRHVQQQQHQQQQQYHYQMQDHMQPQYQHQPQQQQMNGRMRPPPVPVRQTQSLPQVQQPPPPPQQQQQVPMPPPHQPKTMFVNKRGYQRLDLLGKGGSSRVYRVMDVTTNEIYALKRVALDRTDQESMAGYMNEIQLLKRLDGNHRIIRLIDSEVRRGAAGSKGTLMLLMECGEIDLARLLQQQQTEPVDFVWVSYYWKQMLQAVHIIHEEKIVHSDLKPANFVLVKGQLKLIDFGIANAIANDTTNIQRDHQIGTVNYMSPEAIELPDGMRRLKVGRQSDIWSLGCILYQMVYGQPPFQHLNVMQKMRAIPDGSYEINFPEYAAPLAPRTDPSSPQKRLNHLRVPVPKHVIETIKRCLVRNPKERATIPELLDENWLTMREPASTPPATPPPPSPSPAPALKEDEVVINPFFMSQLLKYGIMLGKSDKSFEGEALAFEATRLVRELQNVRANVDTPVAAAEDADDGGSVNDTP